MKKILAILATMILSCVAVFGLVGCGSEKYIAKEISSAKVEEYGYAIGKNSTNKTNILKAINEVIDENDMDKIVKYYTAISNEETPTDILTFVDLSDNTAGTLNIYTSSGFEPYEFTDEDNKVIGVDIYIMELVAEKLNMKINVVDMDFDFICGKIAEEDNAIGAAGITITDERKGTIDFSKPYYSSVQCILSKEAEGFDKIEDLAGKKIGVQKGTTGALTIEDAIKTGALKDTGAEIIEYDTGAVAFTAMKSGKCDVVVIDKLPAQKLAKN